MGDAGTVYDDIVAKRIVNRFQRRALIKTYFQSIYSIEKRKIEQTLLCTLCHISDDRALVLIERSLAHLRRACSCEYPFAIPHYIQVKTLLAYRSHVRSGIFATGCPFCLNAAAVSLEHDSKTGGIVRIAVYGLVVELIDSGIYACKRLRCRYRLSDDRKICGVMPLSLC